VLSKLSSEADYRLFAEVSRKWRYWLAMDLWSHDINCYT